MYLCLILYIDDTGFGINQWSAGVSNGGAMDLAPGNEFSTATTRET